MMARTILGILNLRNTCYNEHVSTSPEIVGRLYGEGDVVRLELGDDGTISQILNITDANELNRYRLSGLTDQIILPGLVDLHTHLREPGNERSETIETGSKAAAGGGYTCVFAMANTIPPADNASAVTQTKRIADSIGLVEVHPIGAVTQGLAGRKLADMAAMAASDAKVKVFSDDGKCVSDSLVMRRALEYVKTFDGVIAQHAQDPQLTENAQINEGKVSVVTGLQGWPGVAEESIIARDILLADLVGARLHICHLTTGKSVEIVRLAKARGSKVTAEVTPHHLTLSEDQLLDYNPRYKVNPPLRTSDDVQALREGVRDGTIDIIATDHAPHALEMKYCNFQDSAFGMTGLETALQAVQLSLIDTKLISWSDVGKLMSERPAQIGGATNQGQRLEVGAPANLCVYNPKVELREIVPEEQLTRSANTPFKHFKLPGKVISTYYRGVRTYSAKI
jgi:dihydroorotase